MIRLVQPESRPKPPVKARKPHIDSTVHHVSNATASNPGTSHPVIAPGETSDEPIASQAVLDSVVVVIPALNEAASLPLVLDALPQVGRVIVVDNGSSDESAAIAATLGADVVSEPRRGYGSACLKGIERAEQWLSNRDARSAIVVFLDADFSDDPSALMELVLPIARGDQDFVLGSRLIGSRERGAMPFQSVFGNRLACFLMRWLFRAKYSDLGPFRAIRWSSLEAIGMIDRDFGWTIEMQIKASRHGLRVLEVPVTYRRRIGQSKISGTIVGSIKAGYKILWTIARYRVFRPIPKTNAPRSN